MSSIFRYDHYLKTQLDGDTTNEGVSTYAHPWLLHIALNCQCCAIHRHCDEPEVGKNGWCGVWTILQRSRSIFPDTIVVIIVLT